jgi:hypothetical protein
LVGNSGVGGGILTKPSRARRLDAALPSQSAIRILYIVHNSPTNEAQRNAKFYDGRQEEIPLYQVEWIAISSPFPLLPVNSTAVH